ncbi:NucA/NucB deoxyribonuclease domain-containing protein [Streptomyces sp. NBC_00467]|uniref:NucA/NucB deoxyribonuclease domain-containing protein n=1 Tax=Streptomyces sp. NBC_00467 TaxID=2975752 RepID=UPI002E175631
MRPGDEGADAEAAHIRQAFLVPQDTKPYMSAKKVPGQTAKDPLHRTVDSKRIDKNRAAAVKQCKRYWGPNYTNGDKECDEYPFASTYEGAAEPEYDPEVTKFNFSAKLAGALCALRGRRPELDEVALHPDAGPVALRQGSGLGPAGAADPDPPRTAGLCQCDDVVHPARVHGPHRQLAACGCEIGFSLLVPAGRIHRGRSRVPDLDGHRGRVGVAAAGDVQTPGVGAEEDAEIEFVRESDRQVRIVGFQQPEGVVPHVRFHKLLPNNPRHELPLRW